MTDSPTKSEYDHAKALVEEQQTALYWHAREIATLQDKLDVMRALIIAAFASGAVLGGIIGVLAA